MLHRDREIIEPLLHPDETLVAVAGVSLAPDTPYPPRELLTPRRPGLLRKLYAALNPPGPAVDDGAAGMGGGWQSVAGQFVVRMRDQGTASVGLLAVTERRAMVVVDRSRRWKPGAAHAVHWEEPHSTLAELRRHPKGRVDLVFTDGSWAGLVTSSAADADPLATALAHRF